MDKRENKNIFKSVHCIQNTNPTTNNTSNLVINQQNQQNQNNLNRSNPNQNINSTFTNDLSNNNQHLNPIENFLYYCNHNIFQSKNKEDFSQVDDDNYTIESMMKIDKDRTSSNCISNSNNRSSFYSASYSNYTETNTFDNFSNLNGYSMDFESGMNNIQLKSIDEENMYSITSGSTPLNISNNNSNNYYCGIEKEINMNGNSPLSSKNEVIETNLIVGQNDACSNYNNTNLDFKKHDSFKNTNNLIEMKEYDLCAKNYSTNDNDYKDEASSTNISSNKDNKNTKIGQNTNKKNNKNNISSSKKQNKKKIFLLSKIKNKKFKKSFNKEMLFQSDNESNNSEKNLNEVNETEYNIESESDNNSGIKENYLNMIKMNKRQSSNSKSKVELSLNEDKEATNVLYDTSYLNLKQEKLKTLEKEFLEKKRAKDNDNSDEKNTSFLINKLNADKRLSEELNPISALIRQTKTEIKIEKNRLSAKRSRDKQKKRLEDLESLTVELSKENSKLLKEHHKMERLLNQYNYYVNNSLCRGCKDDYKKSYCAHEYNMFFKKGKYNRKVDNNQTQQDNDLQLEKTSNPIKKAFNSFNSFNINSNGGENNNGVLSFSPLKGFSIFAGVLFVICSLGVLLSANSGIPSNSTNKLNPQISKSKSSESLHSYEKIDNIKIQSNTQEKTNNMISNKEGTNSRRMLVMNPSSTSYYSNYDFSKDIDLKSFQNMKAINTALSQSIELNTNNNNKILFETYKDYSKKNYKTINTKEQKEILK